MAETSSKANVGWPKMVYFDCFDGRTLFTDVDGTNCADLREVREAAGLTLMAIAHDNVAGTDGRRELRILARDSAGRRFSEASLVFRTLMVS